MYLISEPSQNSLGPISINCNPHSTTSPKTSPNGQGLLTTTVPMSPPEDDISVTASPTPSPPPSQTPSFSGVLSSSNFHGNHLFNNALAASLFLNAPLLPPPGQWLYSHLYPTAPEWPWLQFRQGMVTGCSPDSSDKTNEKSEKNDDELSPKSPNDGSVNLTVSKTRKATLTLVKDNDDDVSSSEKTDTEKSTRNSDVWRPY